MKTRIHSLLALALVCTACSRYPANEYECRMEASKAPTVRGVNEASGACDERFKSEDKVPPR